MMTIKAIAFATLFAGVSLAQTNDLWLMPFTPPTNAVSLTNLCLMIERQSVARSPKAHGVRVVLPRDADPVPIRLDGTNWTMLAAVRAFADCTSTELRLADDIALLLPPTPYRYIIVAVDGRCEDAATGKPIQGIQIKAEWPYDPIMYINTNGTFACGIAKRFLCWPDAGALLQTEKERPGAVSFTLSAPGYEPRVVTNCFYQDNCAEHSQTFTLKKIEDGEQIGAP